MRWQRIESVKKDTIKEEDDWVIKYVLPDGTQINDLLSGHAILDSIDHPVQLSKYSRVWVCRVTDEPGLKKNKPPESPAKLLFRTKIGQVTPANRIFDQKSSA